MSKVIVKYNGAEMSPTPTVSRSMQFVDYGLRWGQIEQIDLSCYATGFSGSGVVTQVVNLFSGQFKTLEVYDDSSLVYKWPYTVVQEIVFPRSTFSPMSMTPFSVRLLSYQVPSGITEPVNEYSFTQGTDSIVTVNHRISAKGVKTDASALDNAIAFVKQFVKSNPFTGCAPAFIPNGQGILFSIAETINRAEGSYSVNETYKFVTGSTLPYVETTTLSINDSATEDYVSLDLNVRWQGSPITGAINALSTAVSSFSLANALSSYGISASNIYQNTFSVSQDSGAVAIEFKANLISGVTNEFSGFFDYTVSFDEDVISNMAGWRVDGEFICKGPISFRKSRINDFKTTNGAGSFIPYLKGLITNSALYSTYNDFALNPIPTQLSISENTGMATLRLSATFNDADTMGSLLQPKYSVDVEPSKWTYELMPAANIEGHYTLQDLQVKSRAKIKLSMSSATSGNNAQSMADVSGVLNTLSGIYVSNAFLIADNYGSGVAEVSMDLELLGKDTIGDSLSNAKVHGSFNNGYTRLPGFKFGF
jgi:hypothetical protein